MRIEFKEYYDIITLTVMNNFQDSKMIVNN